MKPTPGISTHFSYEEMTQSDVAEEHKIANVPSQIAITNMTALAVNLLEPLRDIIGRPIQITSGYRSRKLNSLVGGSARSQHCRGQAADIHVHRLKPIEVAKTIVKAGLHFDQLIIELGWLHVSYSRTTNRNECLISRLVTDGAFGFEKLTL